MWNVRRAVSLHQLIDLHVLATTQNIVTVTPVTTADLHVLATTHTRCICHVYSSLLNGCRHHGAVMSLSVSLQCWGSVWVSDIWNKQRVVDSRLPWRPCSSSSSSSECSSRPRIVVVVSIDSRRVVRLQCRKCRAVSTTSNYRLKHCTRTALIVLSRNKWTLDLWQSEGTRRLTPPPALGLGSIVISPTCSTLANLTDPPRCCQSLTTDITRSRTAVENIRIKLLHAETIIVAKSIYAYAHWKFERWVCRLRTMWKCGQGKLLCHHQKDVTFSSPELMSEVNGRDLI